jgi:hypothetical protein
MLSEVQVGLGGATGLGMTVAGSAFSGRGCLMGPSIGSLTGRLQQGTYNGGDQLGERCIGWPLVVASVTHLHCAVTLLVGGTLGQPAVTGPALGLLRNHQHLQMQGTIT